MPAFGVYACWAWRERSGLSRRGQHRRAPELRQRPALRRGLPARLRRRPVRRNVGLSFIQRLRGEKKFADIASSDRADPRDAEAARRDPGRPAHPGRRRGERRGWQELVHTADWAIRVRGTDAPHLFANAAVAMYSLQDADLSHADDPGARGQREAEDLARTAGRVAEPAAARARSWAGRCTRALRSTKSRSAACGASRTATTARRRTPRSRRSRTTIWT